jgi:hypothetical protein
VLLIPVLAAGNNNPGPGIEPFDPPVHQRSHPVSSDLVRPGLADVEERALEAGVRSILSTIPSAARLTPQGFLAMAMEQGGFQPSFWVNRNVRFRFREIILRQWIIDYPANSAPLSSFQKGTLFGLPRL